MKTFLRGWAKYEKLINLILFVIAVVFPLAFSRAYFINIGTLCLVYVLLSLSLNILTGYMGITGLGWAGFFGIATTFAGLAGAFYAHYISFIGPSNFTFDQSTIIISMTVMGGLGNLMGSVLGAITLTVLPEVLRPLMDVRQIVYGVLLIIMMLVRPQGLLGGFNLKHIRQQNQGEDLVYWTLFTPWNHARAMIKDDAIINAHTYSRNPIFEDGLKKLEDAVIRQAEIFFDAGVDGMYYASRGGEINRFEDEIFQKYVKHYDLSVLQEINKRSKINIFHMCGDNLRMEQYRDYDCVVATNREIDRVALYRLQNSDGLW